MTTHIALLRGVNVAGANRLPMAAFREMLAGLGLTRVQTCIASGNAVFDSLLAADALPPLIRDAIHARFGFAPDVFIVTPADLHTALHNHPFADAAPEKVHVFFLSRTPPPLNDAALQALAAPGDAWHVSGCMFHLHTPAGIGRSKLADKLHYHLPGPMTARNLRTVRALVTLTHP